MTAPLIGLLAFLAAWPATAAIRGAAVRRDVLDRPNARSSHTVPTPRGGGLSFVAVVLLLLLAVAEQPGGGRLAAALLVGGLPVAAVGLVDDLRSLPAAVRAAVHTVAAAAVVLLLDLPLPGGWQGLVLGAAAVVGLVWSINLYNFMDGIDGLAGGQAAVAAVALAVLVPGPGAVDHAALALAGAVLGFLVLNAPPAKIFMGDVGSGFLGLVLGVLLLAASTSGAPALPVLALVVAPFLVDATATLAVRVARGERWYEPHRDHVYQRLTRRGWSHRRVSAGYVLLAGVLSVEAVLLDESRLAVPVAAVTAAALLAAWTLARRLTREQAAADG